MTGGVAIKTGGWAVGTVIALCALAGGVARADVVSAEGRPIAVNVHITGLRNGQLFYRLANGQEISRGIEQIRYLQISGWETFNQAERQQREGQNKLAISSYEQCSAELVAGETASEAFDRSLLLQCRLAQLYDRQGQFEQAVAAYLAVIEKMPAAVESLRPERLPKNDPQSLRKAADLVDAAIARRDRFDPVAVSLEKWRATWPAVAEEAPRPETAPPAGTTPVPLPPTRGRTKVDSARSAAMAELRQLVEAGKFEAARDRLAALKDDPAAFSEERYYWEGRARLGIAGKQKGTEAQVERRRAGLAFMRVVIHWPHSPLAAECLFRAGEICRENGQPERAAALWTELTTTYPNASPWAQRARQELGRAGTPASRPAR
ncbi:MAG TPA: tetratricopeptide repeat protein [Phycisphaerae bacterium]|nr:tetratricopeptide repeat protein [Phycisphaerae bacterium]HOB73575.1 tetratricopeptide repeat protein [Phycisphaerae bacterium]HOJ55804.1 tetratricopeptide repeat protein [Phycisphaerae bacterium]HOL25828.1 tetratricopeptide repeat protein [Phycisphaerae bacterium]HPP21298.1 tetratricopeptide repeat protein [Phycisphaerae bacterium]